MRDFIEKIHTLRRDDHRYYHQCRINQSLHLVSALSFLAAYAWLFIDASAAGLLGWLVGMVARQSGHLFFEPRGYDHINGASDAHKEAIKVGYNMRRKAVLIGVWLALPLLLWLTPSLFGLITPDAGTATGARVYTHGYTHGYLHDLGLIWLALGAAGLLLRTLHLFHLRSPAWGLAWMCKILTDPLHNVAIYWKSPLFLLRGERFDPIVHA